MSVTVHNIAPQILAPFDKSLQEHATSSLQNHKVQVKSNSHITNVTAEYIETKEDGKIGYGMLIWATGNKNIPLVDDLNVSKSTHGLRRILTNKYLKVRRTDGTVMPDAYALGDAADIDKHTLPTTAEVAVQKAKYLVNALKVGDESVQPFRYQQKAMVTYTGEKDGAVGGKHDYSGYAAWLAWRAGNLRWTGLWRHKVTMCMAWLIDWIDGREIARN